MLRQIAGLIAGLSMALAAHAASAQTVVGDWVGPVVIAPSVSLKVAVHIHRDAAGALAGTLDSLDRTTYGMKLDDVAQSGGSLTFTLPTLKAAVAAKWDPATGGWTGPWTQNGRTFTLTLTPGTPAVAPVIAGLDGDWDGALAANGGMKLHLSLHVVTGPYGTAATFKNVEQQATAAVSAISRICDKVRVEINPPGAVFEAVLDPKGQTLSGTFSQGGLTFPLVLTHRVAGLAGAELRRPQTPVKPYPYREVDAAFEDEGGHVKLAGTLTLPEGVGPFPAVVLVSGSGPNTRNEPILGHQLFLVLADHLTRHGIAVLRYDKRGTGASTGDYAKATTQDFANDADAAAIWLRGRKEVDPAKVGLIGHSEGGLIVPMVANADPKVDFIVMMAGPGVDGAQVLTEQGRLISKAMGLSDEQVAEGSAIRERMISVVRAEKDPTVAAAKLKAMAAANPKLKDTPAAVIDAQINEINTGWFRFFFNYDPAPALRQVRCPVLAMIGSKDLQVPPDQNLPAIRAALAHNPDAEVEKLPNLNHLFQTAETGAPSEYGEIEETMSPLALDTMTAWIAKHVGPPAH